LGSACGILRLLPDDRPFFLRQAEDRKVGTDHLTEITFHTKIGLDHFGIVIPFRVECGRHLEDTARAELDAEFAALAAVDDEVDLAPGYLDLVNVKRYSPVLHGLVLSRAIAGPTSQVTVGPTVEVVDA